MPAPKTPPQPSQFRIAVVKAAEELLALYPGRLTIEPHPGDYEDVADHIMDVARIMDRWLLDVGYVVKEHSHCNIDMKQFTDVFRGAVEGNATYELTRAAEARREFIREAAE